MIYWITGRAGSGKTTLAKKMAKVIGDPILILDGDDVRKYFPTGFSDNERYEHIMRTAKIAALAESQGITVMIALVSPKSNWRIEARKLFQESKLIYLEGGSLWEGTTYEEPTDEELS